jgi:putative transcriptional regulator
MIEQPGPRHHVPEDALFEHAMGACDPALGLAIACHTAFCARCRTDAQAIDELGGALVERPRPDGEPAPAPGAGARDKLLEDVGNLPAGSPTPAPALPEGLVPFTPPRALARALAAVARPRWRYLAPGTRGIDLPLPAGSATAHLVRLRPGMWIPRHDHGAVEATVVLTGALLEGDERFGPGDIRVRAPGETHAQKVARPELCIALVVNAGRLVPLNLAGRLLKLVARV